MPTLRSARRSPPPALGAATPAYAADEATVDDATVPDDEQAADVDNEITPIEDAENQTLPATGAEIAPWTAAVGVQALTNTSSLPS